MSLKIISDLRGLDAAVDLLRSGGLVVIPTETVYGLASNALDAVAVARIFEAKRRPSFDPLIVHIADVEDLPRVARSLPPLAEKLIDRFWPGPLTLILPKAESLPGIVTSGLDTVAVRLPDHQLARTLIREAGIPLAAPSANTFGQLSPTRIEHVIEDLGNAVDLVVDGGPTVHGVESTIVDVSSGRPVVLRFGALGVEEIAEVLGDVETRTHSSSNPTAPGQLSSHYAPRVPLHIVGVDSAGPTTNAAYLGFSQVAEGSWRFAEVLSADGDLREAAARLFDVLHRLERERISSIHAELVPDEGLGRAINDRLRRAAAMPQ